MVDFNSPVSVISVSFTNVLVDVVENGVRMLFGVGSWDGVVLLLDVNNLGWVSNDERYLLFNGVLFDFVDGKLTDGGDFIWDLDLGGVMLPEFNDVWLIDGDGEVNSIPLGHWEFVLFVVWLLLILGNWDLLGGDEWHLLDDGVVNSLGYFVGDSEVFSVWDLVVGGVWDLLGDNVWNIVGDGVWDLSGGGVWDLEFDLEWHLSGDGVWDFDGDLIWLKGLNIVGLGDVVSSGNLVWDGFDLNVRYLLGNLVLFGLVLGDMVVVFIWG